MKQVVRIAFNENCLSQSKSLFTTGLIYISSIPAKFNDIVKELQQRYQTKFSGLNYTLRNYSFSKSRFSKSSQGQKLWNEIFNIEKKGLESHTIFKKSFKLKLLDMENEYSYILKIKKTITAFFSLKCSLRLQSS